MISAKMTARPLVLAIFVLTILAAPSPAQDDAEDTAPAAVTLEEARAKVESFDRFFALTGRTLPAIEEHEKKQEIRRLGSCDHELVVARLVKLLRDRSDAYRIEAATALGKLKSDSVAADRALFRLLDPRSDNPPLLSAVILALGKHGFRPALENIEKCLQHPDHGVFDAAVKALGEIADLGSLRTLRDAYESNFLDPEKGVNVSVDTGAPGNADRAAAQGKAKTKIRLRRPNRDKVLTEMRETLKKITGQDFAEPKDLMEWMRENEHRIKKEGWR